MGIDEFQPDTITIDKPIYEVVKIYILNAQANNKLCEGSKNISLTLIYQLQSQ